MVLVPRQGEPIRYGINWEQEGKLSTIVETPRSQIEWE